MSEQKIAWPMPREYMTPNQRAYMEYWNALIADDRATALSKALTPDFIAHDLPEGQNDVEGIIAFRERVQKTFPDQEVMLSNVSPQRRALVPISALNTFSWQDTA